MNEWMGKWMPLRIPCVCFGNVLCYKCLVISVSNASSCQVKILRILPNSGLNKWGFFPPTVWRKVVAGMLAQQPYDVRFRVSESLLDFSGWQDCWRSPKPHVLPWPCSRTDVASGTGQGASLSTLSLIREENIPQETPRELPLILHWSELGFLLTPRPETRTTFPEIIGSPTNI